MSGSGSGSEPTQEGASATGGDSIEPEDTTERDALFQAPRELVNETRDALSHDGSEHSSVSLSTIR